MVNFPTPIGGNITDDDIGREDPSSSMDRYLTCVPVHSAIFLALQALLPVIAWNYLKRHQWPTERCNNLWQHAIRGGTVRVSFVGRQSS